MSAPYKLSILILLISFSSTGFAGVYKCLENGNITFSDKPCSRNEKDITTQQPKTPEKKETSKTSSNIADTAKLADKMEASRIQRELSRDIKALENEIEELTQKRDKELEILKKEKESIGEEGDYDDELTFLDLMNNMNDKIEKADKKYLDDLKEINEKLKELQSKQTPDE